MLILRKAVFYILALAYIVFCPLLILYALGYIVKPHATEPIVGTGVIHLATLPANALIYLNNKPLDAKTPATLDRLLPADYDVKIFLEGYRVWEAAIPVEAGKAVPLDRILLIPKEWKGITLIADSFDNLVGIEGTPFLLVRKGPAIEDHIVYDTRKNTERILANPDSEYAKYKVLSYFTVNGSALMVVYARAADADKFLWVEIGGADITIKDITSLFAEKPAFVTWDPSDEENLFAFLGNSINRLDASSGALYPDYAKAVRGLGVSGKQVYILTDKNKLFSTDYDRNRERPLLDEPQIGETVFGASGYFRIMPFTNNIIIFLGEKGELLSNHLPYKFIESGTVGVRFDRSEERVLAWQDARVGFLDFLTEETGNTVFEKGPAFTWVFTGGKAVKEAFWAYGGSHVVFRDGNTALLAGLEKSVASAIAEVKSGSSIFYSDDTGFLYCLEPSGGNLVAVQVVPGRSAPPGAAVSGDKKTEAH